jgi:hypothetical protein
LLCVNKLYRALNLEVLSYKILRSFYSTYYIPFI